MVTTGWCWPSSKATRVPRGRSRTFMLVFDPCIKEESVVQGTVKKQSGSQVGLDDQHIIRTISRLALVMPRSAGRVVQHQETGQGKGRHKPCTVRRQSEGVSAPGIIWILLVSIHSQAMLRRSEAVARGPVPSVVMIRLQATEYLPPDLTNYVNVGNQPHYSSIIPHPRSASSSCEALFYPKGTQPLSSPVSKFTDA